MSPIPGYKDYKGETLKLSPSGRQNDLIPVGFLQISNVNLYYDQNKFPETKAELEPEHERVK